MSRNLSIVECFDAAAAKQYLKRSRIEFIIWIVSFAVLTAIAASLFAVYAVKAAESSTVFLALALVFLAVDLGGLAGSIVSIYRYIVAQRTVKDSATYIRDVACMRGEAALSQLGCDIKDVIFTAGGFYFGDIDTPFVMRRINDNCFSSNYQASVVYVDGNSICYKSALFSLIGQEERILNGTIPFDKVTSISIIKANGIDLFCSQLKVVFGSKCMLFALDPDVSYTDSLAALNQRICA